MNPNGDYLSAGEQPLPTLLFVLFIVFFTAMGVWLSHLRRQRQRVRVDKKNGGRWLLCCTRFRLRNFGVHFEQFGVPSREDMTWAPDPLVLLSVPVIMLR